jgi:hypothetical protein
MFAATKVFWLARPWRHAGLTLFLQAWRQGPGCRPSASGTGITADEAVLRSEAAGW